MDLEPSPFTLELVIETIQIQNLNIYLTCEEVQQLNMNPQEVINYFAEQLKEVTVKVILQDSSL